MHKWVLTCLINVLALIIASYIVPGIAVSNPLALLGAGLLLGVINLLIRPVILLLTIPFSLLTFGLFILIVNTWMVMLTAALMPGLGIHGFFAAFVTSLIVSLCNWLVKDLKEKKR
ncbi:MAG: phage holin family protein [Dehalobacter sp. 4CP]|uniref:phage holin family protein n=1 Tax=Dehalobacter sp. CP TaxID=2594474 RepID=UPI0013CD40A8|nr:phage holin family protein [Dehalobacter sp.]NBJ16898.1 phage holin family protein [Dehalobacter sp. 4CP]